MRYIPSPFALPPANLSLSRHFQSVSKNVVSPSGNVPGLCSFVADRTDPPMQTEQLGSRIRLLFAVGDDAFWTVWGMRRG
jgi:hypothetical protein